MVTTTIDYQNWPRKIIHVDMDAFYAAVEQRDRPPLRGKPVVVGGSPESRGVVSTCSYEARKFGIRSAMASAQAKKLCPQAIFLKPDFQKYKSVSQTIMQILRQHTDLIEPVSLDEAYLDITRHKLKIEDPVTIARLIKQNIQAVTRLTASAGVAPNLFLAKVASDMQKPDGLTVVHPHEILEFLRNLPVRKIPGVGPVSERELNGLKIFTCGDLRSWELPALMKQFGKFGIFLYHRARGEDDRHVEPGTPSKQYSMEETFEKDVLHIRLLEEKLREYAKVLVADLQNEGRMGKTVTVKIKYFDFKQITRSFTFDRMPFEWPEIYDAARRLLEKDTEVGSKPVRLIGLGISNFQTEELKTSQRELFEETAR